MRVDVDGTQIYVLNYVDDMLYYGTNADKLTEFEERLRARFNLETMGQAHWYLGTRINQLSDFDIELDQSRYCSGIVKKYLESAGAPKITRHHETPLALDFIPTADDCSETEEEAKTLSVSYNIDYASCIGSLIYLAMMRGDIVYAVNKLAKYSRKPGKNHFEALLHILRYLHDNYLFGIRFYSEIGDAPITKMLTSQNSNPEHPYYAFSDSSWNDDVDSGRSTGGYIIWYMGGMVDHSSNLPDPVALSLAEAEYNEACLGFMATNHLRMILSDLENLPEKNMKATIVYLDSKSAIALGASYKDTKHTRHIMRRYHYVRNEIAAGRLETKRIGTEYQVADIQTKQLPGPQFKSLMLLTHISVKDQ